MSGHNTGLKVSASKEGTFLITDDHSTWIGSAYSWPGSTERVPARENAYLWAAAPAMYEALKALVEFIDAQTFYLDTPGVADTLGVHMDVARFALAGAAPPVAAGAASDAGGPS